MSISPISFTGTKVLLDSKVMGKQNFWDEATVSGIMREKGGVNIPLINGVMQKSKDFRLMGEYETKGDMADVEKNPIEEKHFEALFNNLFLIDAPHGYHGSLGLQNVYFSDDGDVEFTTFRYLNSYKMTDDDTFILSGYNRPKIPDTFMPSNAENFEELGLCRYLRAMRSEGEKYEFMEKYLTARGELYNSRRLKILEAEGFSPSSDAVRYEAVQKEVFKNPGYEVVDYNLKKMEMYAKKRDAALAWMDGNGSLDGILKPTRRFYSVVLMLDCLKDAVKLNERAEYFSTNASDPDTAKYFDLEKQRISYFANDVLENVRVRGSYNFNDKEYDAKGAFGVKLGGKGLYLGFKENLDAFNRLYSRIDLNDSYENVLTSIKDLTKHYSRLIDSWNPGMNKIFRDDYVA